MPHVHTFMDADSVQRVTGDASLCDYCKETPVAEETKHFSVDNYKIEVGKRFWSNDLRVVQIIEVGKNSNKYADTGEVQTWHKTTDGISDTLTGSMRPYGRLVKHFQGKSAEDFEAGTNYADIKGR